MYGTNFQRQFPSNEAMENWHDAWGSALVGCAAEDIARGLKACMTAHPTFPPTLPEFVALCRPAPVRPEHQIKLPAPRDTKDRSADIQRVLAMLAKKQAA